MLKFLLCDLDETLYPTSNGLMQSIGRRMHEYIMRRYNLPADEARILQKDYWLRYGTTLRGLYLERHIDPVEYLQFVHDVPVADFLQPDPQLRATLARIPLEKAIITNADTPHARRVLEALGVSDLFTRVFDVVCFEYACKPETSVYRRVLNLLGASGEECVLVEDAARNLPPAKALGIWTVLLASEGEADRHIETIYQLADVIADLDGEIRHTEEPRR